MALTALEMLERININKNNLATRTLRQKVEMLLFVWEITERYSSVQLLTILLKRTLSRMKYPIWWVWLSCKRKQKVLRAVKAKKYSTKRKKLTNKRFKISPGWKFWWAICPGKINCNPLPSVQSCTFTAKYLSYLVSWDLVDKFLLVFGGIWSYISWKLKNSNFFD